MSAASDMPRPASGLLRIGAAIVDIVILSIVYDILWRHVYMSWQPIGLGLIDNLIIYFAYTVGLPRKYGATPGKKLCGLVVVDDAYARRLTNNRTVARAFYSLIPITPFLFYYYIFFPYILSDRYEYRVGTGRMHEKMMNHEILTPDERVRWEAFMINVQEPVNQMAAACTQVTLLTIAGAALIMLVHPRRKAPHDLICQTIVIKRQYVNEAPDVASDSHASGNGVY